MRNQPTLAEILSDETGNIRPEVADLLMEPRCDQHLRDVQRGIQARQVAPRRRSRGKGRFILGLIALLTIPVLTHLMEGPPALVSRPEKNPKVEESHKPAMGSATIMDTEELGRVAQDHVPIPARPQKSRREETVGFPDLDKDLERKKAGRVAQDHVRVPQQKSHQEETVAPPILDEDLDPIRCAYSWVTFLTSDQRIEYSIGAHLISKNEVSPYLLAVTKKDRTKLLVREREDDSLYFEVIWPDGQTSKILKEDVTTSRCP